MPDQKVVPSLDLGLKISIKDLSLKTYLDVGGEKKAPHILDPFHSHLHHPPPGLVMMAN